MFIYCKWYISIVLTSLTELILIRLANQKSVIFVTTDIFLHKGFNFQQMSVIDVMIYQ